MSSTNVIIIFGFICGCLSSNNINQKFEKCKIESNQRKFDVLPGRGWDNLNNEEKGQIINLNFSKCQYSQDNQYLMPNDVSLIPVKISDVELDSKSFKHFINYTSVTSESINLDARGSFFSFSFAGSFSKEKKEVKMDQILTKSSITRVLLRYNVFKVISEVDAELSPLFRNRILDIAGLVLEGKDYLYPTYLADMIIRDYGTHVTRSIDAGAVLTKIDYLKYSYTKKYESNSEIISASATASFGNFFRMSAEYSKGATQSQVNEYIQNSEKTKIHTHGGKPYGFKYSADDWRLTVLDNLVAINREGDPIYYVITPKSFPEIDGFTINRVSILIKEALKRYYIANGRKGCLDINAINFNPDANIDNKNCESPKRTFHFGGTYRTCSGPYDQCNTFQQVNPITGSLSCPPQYISILLNDGLNSCAQYCHRFWFWTRCHSECSFYATYWCSPVDINNALIGYQFGGFLSNEMKNCPIDYFPITVGISAQMCVSLNNDPLNPNSINFGGLFSCKSANPFVGSKMCAKGYIAHLVNIDQGCEIAYCTETNKVSLGYLPPIIRPPFISLNYNPNSTKVIVFSTLKGETYVKTVIGDWKRYEAKSRENKIIAGCVVGTFLAAWIIFGFILFYQRRFYQKKRNTIEEQPLIDQSSTNYGTMKESA